MEQLNHIVAVISLTMGVAWASGINLYAAILVLGWLGITGNIALPAELAILQNPFVIAAAGFMFVVEFVADKIPGVDTSWDAIQTFVRIPAGAVLAAGAIGQVDPAVAVAAGLVGGGVAAATHATKAGTRVLINASPEPFSNWLASLTEDVSVVLGLWLALHHPWLFVALFVFFVLLVVWLLPKIWQGIKNMAGIVTGLFSKQPRQTPKPIIEESP